MDTEKQVDLGSWTGLQQAFAVVSGSCSAARAQCLKHVRDSKMLDDLGLTGDEFCKEYAGISRQHADHLILQYAKFGDGYFRLSEIARVSDRTYRQIAPHVDGKRSRSMAKSSPSPRPTPAASAPPSRRYEIVPARPPQPPALPPI
jgi:hypothetical protein